MPDAVDFPVTPFQQRLLDILTECELSVMECQLNGQPILVLMGYIEQPGGEIVEAYPVARLLDAAEILALHNHDGEPFAVTETNTLQ